MKKALALPAALLALALLLGACGTAAGSAASSGAGSDAASHQAASLVEASDVPRPDFSARSEALEDGGREPESARRFVNQTTDMTFTIGGVACAPGESLALDGPLEGFGYSNGSVTGEQEFMDLAELTVGAAQVLARDDATSGYVLEVDAESWEYGTVYYMLVPQGLYWLLCDPTQKLFLDGIPHLPIAQLLELFPGAVLPLGPVEVDWPGGYVHMLWCYQPLYNLRFGSTSFAGIDDDGTTLYMPVDWGGLHTQMDWAALQGTTLEPDAPLFTDIVSVGSGWLLALSFEDADGAEYLYLAGENGKGGDRASLILHPLDGRVLSPEEYDLLLQEQLAENQ